MRFGFAFETATFDLPTSSLGRPFVILVHVSPPSVLRYTPPSRAPEMIVHGLRSARHIEANSTLGLPGWNSTSTAPVLSETKRTFCHVRPPSFVRNTPRSALGLNPFPMAATKATLGSVGWMRMPPMWPDSRSPMCVHVVPASVDLYTPSPTETLDRRPSEPVPT